MNMSEKSFLETLAAYIPSVRDSLEERYAEKDEGLREAIEHRLVPLDTTTP